MLAYMVKGTEMINSCASRSPRAEDSLPHHAMKQSVNFRVHAMSSSSEKATNKHRYNLPLTKSGSLRHARRHACVTQGHSMM